jgi:hypothetical protein
MWSDAHSDTYRHILMILARNVFSYQATVLVKKDDTTLQRKQAGLKEHIGGPRVGNPWDRP